jgi:hypothetical protein
MYINGKKHSVESTNISGNTITGYTLGGSGGTNTVSLDSILISEKPNDVDLTIVDGETTSTDTYLEGTIVTLPAPAGKTGYTFKGWKKDGDTDLLAAGTIVTATTTTYTAVYETITTAVSAYFVPKDSNVSVDGMTPVSGKYGGSKGSTVATAFTTSAIPTGASNYMTWDITVAADSFIKDADTTKFDSSTLIETAASGISKYETGFKLRLGHALPTISGQPEIIFGLVINGLYAASGTTATAAYADSIPSNYDTITFGTLSSGNAVDGSVTNATTSETTAFGELMSIDSILTMMYDEDELAEITGDIASEDNADITGIDDEIDMTDYNDNGEAVGE